MNLPEDGIYVKADFYEKNREACGKFIKASLAGWKYAFEHKDEAVKLMTKLANQTDFKTTEKKQRVMLDEVEKMMEPGNTVLKEKDFDTAMDILKSARIIKRKIDFDVFTGKKTGM